MPQITLPDGSQRVFEQQVTGYELAQSIGQRLARDAVAVRVDDELRDLNRPLPDEASVAIITRDSEEGLELLRHDAAHVMAEAVKELYPDAQFVHIHRDPYTVFQSTQKMERTTVPCQSWRRRDLLGHGSGCNRRPVSRPADHRRFLDRRRR